MNRNRFRPLRQRRAGGTTSIDGGGRGARESSQSRSGRASSKWRLRRRRPLAAVGMHGLSRTGGKCFVGGGLARIRRSDLASSERPRLTAAAAAPGSRLSHGGGRPSSSAGSRRPAERPRILQVDDRAP
jgi:hypothetical protein